MPRFCPPFSKAPKNWEKGAKDRWTCLGCHRGGLRIRHRHRAWPPPIKLPVYGERRGSRREIVAEALVSPIDAWLGQYLWRQNLNGYVYRQSRVGGRRPGAKAVNLYIHREILGLKPGDPLEGHHKDDDPLNNQRWNLEVVTRSENEKYKYRTNIRNSRLPDAPPSPAADPSDPATREAVFLAIRSLSIGGSWATDDDVIQRVSMLKIPPEKVRASLRDLLLQNKVYNHAGKGTYRAL